MRYEDFLRNNPDVGIKICPVCGKRFIPLPYWAYKKDRVYYCRYNCYRQGGGANETKRNYTRENVNNKKRKGV